MLRDVWHFLVANGLYHYVVGWLTGFFMAGVIAPLWKRFWRARRDQIDHVIDQLDTESPGGLHDVVHELEKLRATLEDRHRHK